MLKDDRVIAFVPVTDIDRAMHFYSDVLGLVVTDCTEDYCSLDAGGVCVRLTRVAEHPDMQHTVVGWSVDDVEARTAELASRGLAFHRYDGIHQGQTGIWPAPNGDQVAWFSDPDGNNLSITQFANVPVRSSV